MHKLIIHQLGPIEHCELECSHFMTLTGFQASGKSTIAKAIYYFRTIKNDILELIKSQALDTSIAEDMGHSIKSDGALRKKLENYLREKFLRTFGSSWGMSNQMCLEYYFAEDFYIKISLTEHPNIPNYIWIELCPDLKQYLKEKNACFANTPLGLADDVVRTLNHELSGLFHDAYSVVYIPAGRSMITLLSQQLSYIYATMDDMQKRSLDSCTQDYLERILRIKPEFSNGLQGLIAYASEKTNLSPAIIKQALYLFENILRGAYRYQNGEEQIVLPNGKYVKLNFSSSGQQECVWILNLLFYYLLQQKKILFIIEEPESHLFPESQKYITEFIALVSNCGHSVMLTTHSPYVLGTLNNLLYAYSLPQKYSHKADQIIPKSLWLDDTIFHSWFVKNGTIENCMDSEIHMIQNERIDEISKVINQDFDSLLNLQYTEESEVL